MKHGFTFILEGMMENEALNRLFRAGWSDASFGMVEGAPLANFRREAERFSRALTSAIAAVGSVGGFA
jgi:hypothetical protein